MKINSFFFKTITIRASLFFCLFNAFSVMPAFADYTIALGTTVDAKNITNESGVLTINGTLNLTSNVSLLKFTSVIINGTGGKIFWAGNYDLKFAEGTQIVINNQGTTGGLQPTYGNGNASQRMYIGLALIAVSSDNSNVADFSFEEFNGMGGLPQYNITSNSPVCSGSTITVAMTPLKVSAEVNYSYKWSIVPQSGLFTPDNTRSSVSIVPSTAGDYTITCEAKANTYLTSKTIVVTVRNTNTWLGATTDWNSGVNWCTGVPPQPDVAVTIPATQNNPVMQNSTFSVKNITIEEGATLTVKSTLQISGTLTNNGTLDATNGTLEFNGTTTQTLSGSIFKDKSVKNLVVSNVSTDGLLISNAANDTLNILGTLSFGNANAKLNSGNNITLKSNAAGTANIGVVGTNNKITGQFIVERFINIWEKPVAGQHGKSWQLIATPTDGQSIKDSWMENGVKGGGMNGFGTQITGSGTGFDLTTGTPSLKYYDQVSNNYKGITNTNDKVYRPGGYMLFVRGDRNVAFPNVGNTTLRTKGNLITGATTPITVHKNSYECVGNPYASAIDLRKITTSGLDEFFYVWDPALTVGSASQYGLGGFQTLHLSSDGNYYAIPGGGSYGSGINNYIQSGQAFFVQATKTEGTLSFTESVKQSGSKLLMRPMGSQSKSSELRTNLYGINPDGSAFLADGALLQYGDDYSSAVDGMDARKVANTSENLSIKSGGKILAIERRETITEADTVVFNLTTVKVQSYRYEFVTKNLSAPGLEGWVEDAYLKTSTPLELDGTTTIDFKIENIPGAYAANRFSIVFKKAATTIILPVTFVSVKATQKNADIAVEWKVENESNLKQYEVEKSLDGNTFSKVGTLAAATVRGAGVYNWLDQQAAAGYNYYRIRSVDINGQTSLTQIVKVLVEKTASSMKVYPNPAVNANVTLQLTHQPAGIYYARLLNPLGQVIISKQILHTEGSSNEIIEWNPQSARGNYQLQITKPEGTSEAFAIVF
ncbi:MAG: T9SS type A sorting domain-containing protein [Ginsengibacter sp.]